MAWNKAQRQLSKYKTDVYRIRSADGRLLYVGSSVNVFKRMREHRKYSGWWQESDSGTVQQFGNRRIARHVEAVAIRDEMPVFNVTRELSELRTVLTQEDMTPIDQFEIWRDGDTWWVDG
jgi:predicted GIY-YIG superfamily endonuclease